MVTKTKASYWVLAALVIAFIIATSKRRSMFGHIFQKLMKERGLDVRDYRHVAPMIWTDSALARRCFEALGPNIGKTVFALAYLEQGENHIHLGFNTWGIEAWKGPPGYGWTFPTTGTPGGWTARREGRTGLIKPYVVFHSWTESLAFMGFQIRKKGLNSFGDYIAKWNPVLPPDRISSAAARWTVGEGVFRRETVGLA